MPANYRKTFFYLIILGSLISGFFVQGQTTSLSSSNATDLVFTEGSAGIAVDESIVASSSAGGGRLQEGYVKFIEGYQSGEDTLFIDLTNPPVDFTWDENTGELRFIKAAKDLDYQTAMRAVKYQNSSNNPDLDDQLIEFYIIDKNGNSASLRRTIKIEPVNDAPWFYVDNQQVKVDTLGFATNKNQSIEICPDIYDPEGNDSKIEFLSLANDSGEISVASSECLNYVPNNDFTGHEYISVKLSDPDDASVSRNSVIEVLVSEAPEISNVNESLNYLENAGLVAVNTNLTILYAGTSLSEATIQINTNYSSAEDSLIYDGNDNSLNVTWDDDNAILKITGTADKTAYRDALRLVKYINSSENPSIEKRSIVFRVSDNGIESGQITTDITVASQNDAPYIYNTAETQAIDTLVVSINEDQSTQICPNVFDIEGDPFSLSIETPDDFSSVVTLNTDGECADFTPLLNTNTDQFFSFKTCDVNNTDLCKTTVVQVKINPINDAPQVYNNGIAVDSLYYGVDINQSIEICLEVQDIESDQVTIQSIPGPYEFGNVSGINNLCFSYQPNTDVVGNEYLKVIVCDDAANSLCDTVTVQIEIPGTNTAPQFNTNGLDTLHVGVLATGSIKDSLTIINRERDILKLDTAYLTKSGGALEVELNEDLHYNFEPSQEDSVIDNSIFCKICDERTPPLCDSLWIELTINYPPSMNSQNGIPIDTLEINMLENTQLDTCFQLFDLNNQSVFNAEINSNRNGILNTNIDNQTDQICLSYNPETDYVGTEEFNFTLCDNGDPEGCSELLIIYAVYETNTAPIYSSASDSSLVKASFSLLENDSLRRELNLFDLEDDLLFIDTVFNRPAGLEFEISDSTMILEFKPEINKWGTYETTVRVCDDNPFSLCSDLQLTLEVEPVNEAPVILSDSVTITSSEEKTIQVLANDYDTENEGLYIAELISQSTSQGIVYLEDSVIIYQPDPDEYRDTDVITYTVCDGGVPQACIETTLTIVFNLPVPELKIYDAFSPNGDGVNDTWFLDGIREYTNNQVTITDQYNNVVFAVSAYDNRLNIWSGEPEAPGSAGAVPEGTYYYVIDLGNDQEPITGYVILKR